MGARIRAAGPGERDSTAYPAGVIAEAPFLFAIAGLSASLAGLAGLVAALRRGSDLRAIDGFRLREIVEFAFANIVLSVSVVPLAQLFAGGVSDAARIVAAGALIYLVGTTVVLTRRMRSVEIGWTVGWRIGAGVIVIISGLLSLAVIATGSVVLLELTLILLLARPMTVFVLVLSSFEGPSNPVG